MCYDCGCIMFFSMHNRGVGMGENPQNWIMCDRHPAYPVVFVCISHENCEYSNLMCMECHDELPKTHDHHLISLNKFELFNAFFAEKAASSLEEVRQVPFMLTLGSAQTSQSTHSLCRYSDRLPCRCCRGQLHHRG
jgi:hypothetical protein